MIITEVNCLLFWLRILPTHWTGSSVLNVQWPHLDLKLVRVRQTGVSGTENWWYESTSQKTDTPNSFWLPSWYGCVDLCVIYLDPPDTERERLGQVLYSESPWLQRKPCRCLCSNPDVPPMFIVQTSVGVVLTPKSRWWVCMNSNSVNGRDSESKERYSTRLTVRDLLSWQHSWCTLSYITFHWSD